MTNKDQEKELLYVAYLEIDGKIKSVQKVMDKHIEKIDTIIKDYNEKQGFKAVELLVGRELEVAAIKVDERECYMSRIKELIDDIHNLDYEVSSLRSSAENIFEVIKKEVDNG